MELIWCYFLRGFCLCLTQEAVTENLVTMGWKVKPCYWLKRVSKNSNLHVVIWKRKLLLSKNGVNRNFLDKIGFYWKKMFIKDSNWKDFPFWYGGKRSLLAFPDEKFLKKNETKKRKKKKENPLTNIPTIKNPSKLRREIDCLGWKTVSQRKSCITEGLGNKLSVG